MTSDEVKAKVAREIAEWQAPVIEPGSTIGIPWDAARYAPHLAALRSALVAPFQELFRLRETYEQVSMPEPPTATYWVVAVTSTELVWFDDTTGDFGLAKPASSGEPPESIGVRGDLVGTFSAR